MPNKNMSVQQLEYIKRWAERMQNRVLSIKDKTWFSNVEKECSYLIKQKIK